jgi:hypothetical protein
MDIPAKLGIPAYDFRAVIGDTTIDYDLNKEEINRKKHGYSLESAVHMLERLLLPSPKPRPHFVSDAFEEIWVSGDRPWFPYLGVKIRGVRVSDNRLLTNFTPRGREKERE